MGQKVNPHGLRVGVIKGWNTQWYADKKDFSKFLKEDYEIRKYLKKKYYIAAIAKITIERAANKVTVSIHTAKPGAVIGREGAKKTEAVKALEKLTGKNVYLTVVEVKVPDLDAVLVARKMAEDLENRISFRRVQKSAIQKALKAGAKGIKTQLSGRLGGAEIARSEGYIEGSVPLHTFRANIDYAVAEAATTYGKIGVKVWINKGEILTAKQTNSKKEER